MQISSAVEPLPPAVRRLGLACAAFAIVCVGGIGFELAQSDWLGLLSAFFLGGALAMCAGSILRWRGEKLKKAMLLSSAFMTGYLVMLIIQAV